MTTNTLWAVQAAVYAALSESARLASHLAGGSGGIHDHVPANAAFPYVVIAGMSARPSDTQTHKGSEVTLTIRSYSKNRGMKEARTVMSEISAVLHGVDLTADGIDIVLCTEIASDSYLDAANDIRAGVQTFRIITEQ